MDFPLLKQLSIKETPFTTFQHFSFRDFLFLNKEQDIEKKTINSKDFCVSRREYEVQSAKTFDLRLFPFVLTNFLIKGGQLQGLNKNNRLERK